MGLLDKVISGIKGDVVETISKGVDEIATSEEEKLAKKNELADKVMGHLKEAMSYQRDVLNAELQGNGLQRNWRPIVMLAFAFIVIYRYFIAPIFSLVPVELPERFFDLLELGIGGYVIGRSVEKVADAVTKNVDMTFLKKKDRK